MTGVKIKFLESGAEGFHVTLNYLDGSSESVDGFLPALPAKLESSFKYWQAAYDELDEVRKVVTRLSPKKVTRYSGEQEKEEVKTSLNQWLDDGDNRWRSLRDELISILTKLKATGQEMRLFIDVKNQNLQRLPWQEWDLLQSRFPEAEIAVRVSGKGEIKPFPQGAKVRILVVVGNSDGINTESDLEVIKKLEEKGVEVKYLKQPTREIFSDALHSEPGYHIFIYTGHSCSKEDGSLGYISLKKDDVLNLEKLKSPLRKAIDNGLQLAIFNSCDGMGLAAELAKLSLPRIIAMREPVPDEVAVKFLEYFFEEFVKDKSLFASVRTARGRLEHFEKKYPGAIWLPTLCIRESSLSKPLSWQTILDTLPLDAPPPPAPPIPNWKKLGFLAAGLLGLGIIVYLILRPEPDRQVSRVSPVPPLPLSSCPKEPLTIAIDPTVREPLRCIADVAKVMKIPNGTWQHGGSTSWAPIRDKANPLIEQIFPDFNLSYTQHPSLAPGSGTGIVMLLQGQISFAESSRSVRDDESPTTIRPVPIAIDAIAVVVHPSLNIEGLTIQQLQNIYTGRITNWVEVGGPNLEITPYYRSTRSGTTRFFKLNVLGGEDFGYNAVELPTTTKAVQMVAKNENTGGIYFASASEVVPQCGVKPVGIRSQNGNFVNPYQGDYIPPENCPEQGRNEVNQEAIKSSEYPITRRLFAIVKQDNSIDQQVGEAYAKMLLTDEGQKCIENLGFVPLRSPGSDDSTICKNIENNLEER